MEVERLEIPARNSRNARNGRNTSNSRNTSKSRDERNSRNTTTPGMPATGEFSNSEKIRNLGMLATARVPNFEQTIFFGGRRKKMERTTVSSDFRLISETKNFQNSIPNHSTEQERYQNFLRIIPRLEYFHKREI
jgi:hypothetical protein